MKFVLAALIAALAVTSSTAFDSADAIATSEANAEAVPVGTDVGDSNASAEKTGLRGRRKLWYSNPRGSSAFASVQATSSGYGGQGYMSGSTFTRAGDASSGNQFNSAFGSNGPYQVAANFQSGATSNNNYYSNRGWPNRSNRGNYWW